MIQIRKINKLARCLSRLRSDQSGFTLLELLLTSFLFVLLLLAISGIYMSFSRVQARANASQKLLNDSQYVLELMAREIRNDVIFDFNPTASACVDLVGADYANCILLLKDDGRLIAFAEITGALRYVVLDCDSDYSACTINDYINLLSSSYNSILVQDLDFVADEFVLDKTVLVVYDP